MEENTYIASNEKKFSFFCDSFTHIASKSKAGTESLASPSSTVSSFPISIFSNDLSALEAITKYLKEEKQLRFCEIAKLLNRDDRTVWDAYDSAIKKQPGAHSSDSQVQIPLDIFTNRTFSMLESVTAYLKETCDLRFCHIAALLNKDARTIWTVYSRIKNKRKATIDAEALVPMHTVPFEKHLSRGLSEANVARKSPGISSANVISTQPFAQHNSLGDLTNERKQ